MSDRANIADAYRQLGASRKQLNRRTSCVAAANFFQHNPTKATERSGKTNNTITLKTPVGEQADDRERNPYDETLPTRRARVVTTDLTRRIPEL